MVQEEVRRRMENRVRDVLSNSGGFWDAATRWRSFASEQDRRRGAEAAGKPVGMAATKAQVRAARKEVLG